MSAITIRNVPPAVHDALASQAAEAGQSLQQYLLARLAEVAARPTLADIFARADERARSATRSIGSDEIVAAIHAGRK